ncbi:MAG: DNA pilot protein [Microvirus sp.]|nr:MAG: DNA pilot protein [Microvirus sp.]
MGFLDSALSAVTGGLTGFLGDLPGTLVSGVMNQFSAKQAYDRSQDSAQEAFNRSQEAYKTRYQSTAKDMREAGINPIMAASGGFNVSGQPTMASVQAPVAQTPVMGTGSSSAKNVAEADRVAYEKTEILSRIAKMGEDAALAIQQKEESRSREGVADQQEKNLKEEFVKIKAETLKIAYQISQTQEETANTVIQRKLIVQNIREMKMIADKLEKTNAAYNGPAGEVLGFVDALTDALNLHNVLGGTLGNRGGRKR